MVRPDTFNDDIHVIELFNFVMPETFKLFTFNVEGFVKLLIDVFKLIIAVLLVFIYPNNEVDVVFKLVICVVCPLTKLNIAVDVEFKLVICVVCPLTKR